MPHGIGKLRAGHGSTLRLEAVDCVLVSRQQHIKGRAVEDLGMEPAGRARRDQHAVLARLLEPGLQRARRSIEIRRDGDQRLFGECRRRVKQPDKCQRSGTQNSAYLIRPGQCAPLPGADKPLAPFDGGKAARSRAATQAVAGSGLR